MTGASKRIGGSGEGLEKHPITEVIKSMILLEHRGKKYLLILKFPELASPLQ
jgi:hypothetical protein